VQLRRVDRGLGFAGGVLRRAGAPDETSWLIPPDGRSRVEAGAGQGRRAGARPCRGVFEHGFIEEPVNWTLSPGKRAENPRQTARAQSRAPALTTCPECSAVRFEGHPCPVCKWRPQPKPQSVDVADGELGLVDRDRVVKLPQRSGDDELRFYRQLLYIAEERGYQRGWAAHKYREKLGGWPTS